MTIYEEIIDFSSYLKYVPRGKTSLADAVLPLGKSKNFLPTDRNVTFYFTYTTGKFRAGGFQEIFIRKRNIGYNPRFLNTII